MAGVFTEKYLHKKQKLTESLTSIVKSISDLCTNLPLTKEVVHISW